MTKLLAAVAKWAYQGDDRPHLQVVRFADAEMVACDGHRLVRVPLEMPDGVRFGLRPRDIAALAAAQLELSKSRHRGQLRISVVKDGRALVDLESEIASGTTMNLKTADVSDYPPIEQVMPKSCETDEPPGFCFDPKFLAAINEVNLAAGEFESRGVLATAWSKVDERGLCGPMMFTGDSGIRFVVMPMRRAP